MRLPLYKLMCRGCGRETRNTELKCELCGSREVSKRNAKKDDQKYYVDGDLRCQAY